jgi:hypothetical protein
VPHCGTMIVRVAHVAPHCWPQLPEPQVPWLQAPPLQASSPSKAVVPKEAATNASQKTALFANILDPP